MAFDHIDLTIAARGLAPWSLAAVKLRSPNAIAQGDVSDGGLARKVDRVTEEVAARTAALGVTRPDVVNVYTAHQPATLHERLVARFPPTGGSGYVRWLARPPVRDLEFEMDCRRVSRWQYV